MAEDAENYFGSLNELKTGASSKPPILDNEVIILRSLCNDNKLPLVAGGLLDQPHIWLIEKKIVDDIAKIFLGEPDGEAKK